MENEPNNDITQQTPSLYDIINNFTKLILMLIM